MKFIHIGDLHFGKTLHNVQLIEQDQPFWVEQLLQAVDRYEPDAVVIAGDVYDRKIPSPDAMRLFDHMLTELAGRGKYVFVVPGNHDSAVRLSHVNELLAQHRIYIAGELKRDLEHITVSKDSVDVTFWLMPYIFPKAVSDRRVLDRPELTTYDEAARALIAAQDINPEAVNVLVAHQNVLANGVAPEHSDSETIIGGLGEIEFSAFDPFDYVVLGHIHNAQRVGRDTIRYSGCPLYYDFSEINRRKELTLVTVSSRNCITIEQVPIPILHRLEQFSGSLEDIVRAGLAMQDRESVYVQCVLRDKHIPARAMEQLRDVFGNSLVNVKRELAETPAVSGSAGHTENPEKLSLEEQFGLFYQERQQELLDDDQEALVGKVREQQSRQGSDYCADAKAVPTEDSRELIDFLLKTIMEDSE